MTYDNPPNPKSPQDPKVKHSAWGPEEDDLFGEDLHIDPRDGLGDALDRVLARQKPQPERSAGSDDDTQSRTRFRLRERHDHDPFDRFSGTPVARELESLASRTQGSTDPDPTEPEDEAEEVAQEEDYFDDPGHREPSWFDGLRERWSGGLIVGTVLVGLFGFLVGAAGLFTALQFSGRIDLLEAQFKETPPGGGEEATGALDTEVRSNTATLRSLREELRSSSEQIRSQVSEDIIKLKTEMRELTARTDQRWQALESRTEDFRKGSPRPAAAASAPTTASQPAKALPADARKPSQPAPAGGLWAVHVASFPDAGVADQEVQRLKRLGLETQAHPVQSGGQTWYRLSVSGFPSREAAQSFVAEARKNPRLAPVFADSWIGKR